MVVIHYSGYSLVLGLVGLLWWWCGSVAVVGACFVVGVVSDVIPFTVLKKNHILYVLY